MKEPSTDDVYKEKKCLVKSGKDSFLFVSPNITACFNTQNGLFRRVEQCVSLGRTLCSIIVNTLFHTI